MSWRDYIVTSHRPQTPAPALPTNSVDIVEQDRVAKSDAKESSVDIVDIALKEAKKSSSSYRETDLQVLTPIDISTETTKPAPLTPDQPEPDTSTKETKLTKEVDTPEQPIPPLQPGWLVVYRDATDRLCGGCDDRPHGTVEGCRWTGHRWLVLLKHGETLPLERVRAVSQTDEDGTVVKAWEVRAHGYDGQGKNGTPADR